jgi:transcriptional regulator with XRE-family HTH domain
MEFKENIKNRRLELNLTLDEVSSKLGVSKPTLQRYESGVISNVPFDKIEKLAITYFYNS